jgi:hypothetical protein
MNKAVAGLALALSSVAACDLTDADDPGPPEEWKLGPVAPGDTLVLPSNPCPDRTTFIDRAFEKDEFSEVYIPRAVVDSPEALRIEIPLDAPSGRYAYVFYCMRLNPPTVLLELQWEVRVTGG